MVEYLKFLGLISKLKLTKRQGWVEYAVDSCKDEAAGCILNQELRNSNRIESIADHMYRMSIMALTFPSVNPSTTGNAYAINKDHLLRMCLVHDIAEAIVGDITPTMCIDANSKYNQEKTALSTITSYIHTSEYNNNSGHLVTCYNEIQRHMQELWEEYEAQITPTSKLARDLDLLEMIHQALLYENNHNLLLIRQYQSHTDKTLSSDNIDIKKQANLLNMQSFFNSGLKLKHPWSISLYNQILEQRVISKYI